MGKKHGVRRGKGRWLHCARQYVSPSSWDSDSLRLVPLPVRQVSSPGAERLVRVPQDLIRFQDLPMFVVYYRLKGAEGKKSGENGSGGGIDEGEKEQVEEVLALVSVSEEERMTEWRVADVRVNREFYGGGKGRPVNKRTRERRLRLGFDELKLVRIFLEM